MKIKLISTVASTVLTTWVPDEDIVIYKTVEDLIRHLEDEPEAIDQIYITEDVFKGQANHVFRTFTKGIKDGYIRAKEIYLIVTSVKMKDIDTLGYYREHEGLEVAIIEGTITQDFIASCLRGESRKTHETFTRSTLIRQRRRDFKPKDTLDTGSLGDTADVRTEESRLIKSPSQKLVDTRVIDSEFITRITTVTGLPSSGKTTFMLLLAQYLQGFGKTVVVETDLRYFTISHNLSMSSIDYEDIPLRDFIQNPMEFVDRVKTSKKNLICFTGHSKDKNLGVNVQHIVDVLYNILRFEVRYILLEEQLSHISYGTYTIVTMANNTPSAIHTFDNMPVEIKNCQFVALDTSVENIRISDPTVLEEIGCQIMNKSGLEIPILRINTLELNRGGTLHDLYRYI